MTPKRASDYRFYVALERDTAGAKDDYGQYVEGYTDVVNFLADIDSLRGKEAADAHQVWATASHQVRLRWMGAGTLAPRVNDRIRFPDGTRLNVIVVENLELRNREWILLCGTTPLQTNY